MTEDQKPDNAPTLGDSNPDTPAAYVLRLPAAARAPVLFAVPHSGRHYPRSFRKSSKLDDHQLRLSEDAFVDDLFESVHKMGAGLLVATHARAYVDLNRSINELDPGMFKDGHDDAFIDATRQTKRSPRQEDSSNNRIRAGLGVIPRIVGENMPIYDDKLPAREALYRLNNIYKPYHDKLSGLLMEQIKNYGTSVLIDCHSMPSGPELHRRGQSQPDIILGDCWGTSCNRELTSLVEKLFFEAGFVVRRNIPYAGGYGTRYYGNPQNNCHALQIEINRSIYMDEKRVEKLPCFNEVQEKISAVARAIIDAAAPKSQSRPLAAE